MQNKEKISVAEFIEISAKLEIQTGLIKSADKVPKSDRLILMEVEFGSITKQVVTSILPLIEGDLTKLIDNTFLFVTNLEPVKIRGVLSEAMILPGELEKGQYLTLNTSSGINLI
jgi:methionyl-tRNA synthetase